MQNLVCYFDGCCEPKNPGGNMGIGAVIIDKDTGEHLLEHSAFVPEVWGNSNNVAEYMAFFAVLTWIREKNRETVTTKTVAIYGDSKLVICQMLNQWKMKGGMYIEHARKAREVLKTIRECGIEVSLGWVRRTENTKADELSKKHLLANGIEFKLQPQEPKKDEVHFAVEEILMLEKGKSVEVVGQYLRDSFLSNKSNPDYEFEKFLRVCVDNKIRYAYYAISDKWHFYRPLVTEEEIIDKWKEGKTPNENGMYDLEPYYIHAFEKNNNGLLQKNNPKD